MKRGGGLITAKDLADYQVVWREPIKGTYRGYRIYSMAPPSSGGVLLVQMLNMLEPYDLKASGFGSAATIHLMVEAERRAYADRAEYLGDPDFYPVPIAELIAKPLRATAFRRFRCDARELVDEHRPGADRARKSRQTTHLSVMDAAGNAVAYTTTLNLSFGSKIVVEGAGFLLNNEMDDFSSRENTPNSYGLIGRVANSIEPGKRMLSSMTPTIVVDPSGRGAACNRLARWQHDHHDGAAGRRRTWSTTAWTSPTRLAMPRFHHQWLPDRVIYEPWGISPDTLKILQSRGHTFVTLPWGRGLGDANSVMRSGNELLGMSDPRNRGGAAGY